MLEQLKDNGAVVNKTYLFIPDSPYQGVEH